MTGSAKTSAVGRLLHVTSASERVRESNIQNWLYNSIGIENIELQYITSSGPADIYLSNRRIIIEVKNAVRLRNGPNIPGTGSLHEAGRNESAFEQVTRYVLAERKRERLYLGEDDREDLVWLGIVTDSERWWIWEWDPAGGSDTARPVIPWQGTRLSNDNIGHLTKKFQRVVGKEWAPSKPASLFGQHYSDIWELYSQKSPLRSTKMQKSLWLEQLRAGGNAPEVDVDKMFVIHTLLILVTRLISYTVGKDDGISDGFIQWVPESHIDTIRETINEYNWRQRTTDIMRELYEGFVPRLHRQVYGEYYTPDWLAEKLCLEVIDDAYIAEQIKLFRSGKQVMGILDPCCGSGTFLYHAARRILDSDAISKAYMGHDEQTRFVCEMIHGMDIHPVAVEMAKTNLRRLLPNAPPWQIYQGDSLLTPRSEAMIYSNGGANLVLYSPKGNPLIIPGRFLADSGLGVFVQSAADNADLPPGIGSNLYRNDMEQLQEAHRQLRKIIREEANGIWYWYIRNQAAPLLLRDKKIGRILSNPPWVTHRKIQVKSRKKDIIDMAEKRDLWVGGKNATTFNIAALFVDRCMGLYLDGIRSGWVLPDSVMKSGIWSKYHSKMFYKRPVYWDLGLLPFPKQSGSCVCITGEDTDGAGDIIKRLVKRKGIKGSIPPAMSWNGVVAMTDWVMPERTFPKISSAWLDDMSKPIARMGASITPNCLLIIDDMEQAVDGTVAVTTRRSTQPPWRDVDIMRNKRVPAHWVHHIAMSANLIPFDIPTRTSAILPLGRDGLDDNRHQHEYWKMASDIYDRYRGTGANTPKTLDKQINHHNKLLRQIIHPYKNPVVYNNTGSRLYASRMPYGTIIEHTLFAVETASVGEARFLTALLNADILQEAYVNTQESGRRHYAAHLWNKVPLPRYDIKNTYHRRLVHLERQAEKVVAKAPARRKAAIATLRSNDIFSHIDDIVRKILPDYVI